MEIGQEFEQHLRFAHFDELAFDYYGVDLVPLDEAGAVFLRGDRPTPETFDQFSTLSNISDYYNGLYSLNRGVEYIKETMPYMDFREQHGWQKKKLLEAIENSGLFVHRDQVLSQYGEDVALPYMPKYVLPLENLEITPIRKFYAPGFGDWAYLPKKYYETIYRRIFIDLPQRRSQKKRRGREEEEERSKRRREEEEEEEMEIDVLTEQMARTGLKRGREE